MEDKRKGNILELLSTYARRLEYEELEEYERNLQRKEDKDRNTQEKNEREDTSSAGTRRHNTAEVWCIVDPATKILTWMNMDIKREGWVCPTSGIARLRYGHWKERPLLWEILAYAILDGIERKKATATKREKELVKRVWEEETQETPGKKPKVQDYTPSDTEKEEIEERETHVEIIEEIIIYEGSRDKENGLQNRNRRQGTLTAVETADALQTRREQGQGIPTTD